ncbi:MAG: hypothetical protein A2030_08485 [Chloroflexi bacterium RBG_19FT_COMBO_50_10]|nr:MAG: hypothetical protein A2030_08485 [Chloroflexi bacterium RBG_19FT_COMBO_50_10]
MMPDQLESLLDLFHQHLSWYPAMEPRDLYKLLYQGVMGPEHLIASQEEFTHYLRAEFGRLRPDRHERLFEPVRPDQSLLRLNLRPFKSRQIPVESLIPLLLETAGSFSSELTELRAAWKGFIQSCECGWITNFSVQEIHQFTSWLEKMKFPAVHHSEVYRREYQPAYRLIAAQFIHRLGLDHAG